jgi:tetratricopeptide (TPR) repeat protein
MSFSELPPSPEKDAFSKYFVNRENLLKDFRKSLKWTPQGISPVIGYHGLGGIGKTWFRYALAERVLKSADAPHVIVDFEYDTGSRSAEMTFSRLRSGFEKYGIKFPTFDIVWRRYIAETTGHRANSSVVRPEVASVANIIGAIPLMGNAPQAVLAFIDLSASAVEWLKEHYTDRWRQKLLQMNAYELLHEMPRTMARDLEEVATNRKLLAETQPCRPTIIFDGYEKLSAAGLDDWWVRELFQYSASALKVIFGREPIRWEKDNHQWANFLVNVELKNLRPLYARGYLHRRGVDDLKLQTHLVHVTDGFPYHLQLIADLYNEMREKNKRRPTIDDFQGTGQDANLGDELLKRLLSYFQKDEQTAARLMAIPRWFTLEIMETLSSVPESVPTLFDTLTEFSFYAPILNIPGAFAMKQEARNLLLQSARKSIYWEKRQLQLVGYHQEKTQKASLEMRFLHQLEHLYHLLEAGEKHTDEAIELLEALFTHSQSQYQWSNCSQIIATANDHKKLAPKTQGYLKFFEAELLRHEHRFSEALDAYNQSILLQEASRNFKLNLQTQFRIAELFIDMGQVEYALKQADQTLKLSRQKQDKEVEAQILRFLAMLDYEGNPHFQNVAFLQEALAIFRSLDHYFLTVETLRNLSLTLQGLGDTEQALEYARQAVSSAEQLENPNIRARARHIYARALFSALRYEASLMEYSLTITAFEKIGDRGGVASCERAIGRILRDQPKPDYERAIKQFQKALHIDSKELGSFWGTGRALYELGVCYRQMKDFYRAIENLLLAEAIWGKMGHMEVALERVLLQEIRDELGIERYEQIASLIDLSKSEFAPYFQT